MAGPVTQVETLPSSVQNRICEACETKFNIDKALVYTKQISEHCDDCGVCILKIDHHCGFFDRCIGQANLILFYCVLTLFFCSLIFVIVLLLTTVGSDS